MSIHFKFKSARDYDTITFTGTSMRLIDLKKSIVERKRLNKGLDFELIITNAQTGEVYDDDHQQLSKNTSVIVKRVTYVGNMGGLLARIRNEEAVTAMTNTPAPVVVPTSIGDETTIVQTVEDEMEALKGIQQQATDMRGGARPGNRVWTAAGGTQPSIKTAGPTTRTSAAYGEPNVPPPSYTCFRCGTPGHFIQNCPTNGNLEFDTHKVKKKTGIPKTFMKAVNDPSEIPGDCGMTVVNAPWGGLAVVEPQNRNFSQIVEQSGGAATVAQLRLNPPEHMSCPLCSRLISDAVLIPCCQESACDECLRNALLQHNLVCPLCKAHDMSPEGLLPNKSMRKAVDEFLRNARSQAQDHAKLLKETEEAILAKQRAETLAASIENIPTPADAVLDIKKSKFDDDDDEFGGDIFAQPSPPSPVAESSSAVAGSGSLAAVGSGDLTGGGSVVEVKEEAGTLSIKVEENLVGVPTVLSAESSCSSSSETIVKSESNEPATSTVPERSPEVSPTGSYPPHGAWSAAPNRPPLPPWIDPRGPYPPPGHIAWRYPPSNWRPQGRFTGGRGGPPPWQGNGHMDRAHGNGPSERDRAHGNGPSERDRAHGNGDRSHGNGHYERPRSGDRQRPRDRSPPLRERAPAHQERSSTQRERSPPRLHASENRVRRERSSERGTRREKKESSYERRDGDDHRKETNDNDQKNHHDETDHRKEHHDEADHRKDHREESNRKGRDHRQSSDRKEHKEDRNRKRSNSRRGSDSKEKSTSSRRGSDSKEKNSSRRGSDSKEKIKGPTVSSRGDHKDETDTHSSRRRRKRSHGDEKRDRKNTRRRSKSPEKERKGRKKEDNIHDFPNQNVSLPSPRLESSSMAISNPSVPLSFLTQDPSPSNHSSKMKQKGSSSWKTETSTSVLDRLGPRQKK